MDIWKLTSLILAVLVAVLYFDKKKAAGAAMSVPVMREPDSVAEYMARHHPEAIR